MLEPDEPSGDTVSQSTADAHENVSQLRLFVISIFWFAHMAQWSSLYFIVLPAQLVIALGQDNKATYLALVVMGAGIVSLIASPLFGALSDRTMTTRYAWRGWGKEGISVLFSSQVR
jgi:hypothetical protein